MARTELFFKRLGHRMRELRQQNELSQEDMILFGFSGKHWQQLEAGRPITVTTLLRACEALGIPMAEIVKDLDNGIYETQSALHAETLRRKSSKWGRKKQN